MNYKEYELEICEASFDWLDDNASCYYDWDDCRCDLEQDVTGNDNGSYYCNRERAAEACVDMIWDEGFRNYLADMSMTCPDDPEECDVLVRFYVFGSIEYELENYFNDLKEAEEEE